MSFITKILEKRKNKQNFKKAMEIITNMNKMVESGGIRFDRGRREVVLVKEIFWNGKDENWRANFCYNLALFMDIALPEHRQTEKLKAITIYALNLDTKQKAELLKTYFPKD